MKEVTYVFPRMHLRVWKLNCWGKTVGYAAQWAASSEEAIRYHVRRSKVFGGVGRSRESVLQEAYWWRKQKIQEQEVRG